MLWPRCIFLPSLDHYAHKSSILNHRGVIAPDNFPGILCTVFINADQGEEHVLARLPWRNRAVRKRYAQRFRCEWSIQPCGSIVGKLSAHAYWPLSRRR